MQSSYFPKPSEESRIPKTTVCSSATPESHTIQTTTPLSHPSPSTTSHLSPGHDPSDSSSLAPFVFESWSKLSKDEQNSCVGSEEIVELYLKYARPHVWAPAGCLLRRWDEYILESLMRICNAPENQQRIRKGRFANQYDLGFMFHLLMLSYTVDRAQACPFIVVIHESFTIAKNAVKLLRLHPVIKAFAFEFQAMEDPWEFNMNSALAATPSPESSPPVHIESQTLSVRNFNVCGLLAQVRLASETSGSSSTKITLGGYLTIRGKHYILTTSHAFIGNTEDIKDGTAYSPPAHVITIARSNMPDQASNVNFRLKSPKPDLSLPQTTILNAKLDWALLQIDQKDVDILRNLTTHRQHVRGVLHESVPPVGHVTMICGKSGVSVARSLGMTSSITLPWTRTVIKVWMIYGKTEKGDSGSWVLDAQAQTLYGIVVAHNTRNSLSYIVPAHIILRDIAKAYQLSVDFFEEMLLPANISSQTPQIEVPGHDLQRVEYEADPNLPTFSELAASATQSTSTEEMENASPQASVDIQGQLAMDMETSQLTFPPELLLRFRQIRIKEDFLGKPLNSEWEPPSKASAFYTQQDTGWLTWSTGKLDRPGPINIDHTQINSTTSMFFDPRRYGFVQMPFDCMEEQNWILASENGTDRWNTLSFERPDNEIACRSHPFLWKVGTALKSTEIPLPISDSWRDLLPPPYFIDAVARQNELPTCELAGSLSLLLCLIGFTSRWTDLETVLRESFRPGNSTEYKPTWRVGVESEKGATPYRGLIVDVSCRSKDWSPDMIKKIEEGEFGPILTSNPFYRRDDARPKRDLPTSSFPGKWLGSSR